jgi:hypothetical protein
VLINFGYFRFERGISPGRTPLPAANSCLGFFISLFRSGLEIFVIFPERHFPFLGGKLFSLIGKPERLFYEHIDDLRLKSSP